MEIQTEIQLQALPPLTQREREMKAIQEDPRIKKILENLKIVNVSEFAVHDDGSKEYHVETNTEFFIRAKVIYLPPIIYTLLKPSCRFKIEFGGLEKPTQYAVENEKSIASVNVLNFPRLF